MRYLLIVLWMVFLSASSAIAQVSVSIGINLPLYPELVRVPGYPVYYAPRVNSNFFFYDGMYWVYERDNWYASSWYNGPWAFVAPEVVPLFVLRIPVRYYRNPPAYFYGWRRDAPPRWDDHWGNDWAQHRGGWDQWNRRSVPDPAPLPVYQKKYSGERYPQFEQQREIHNRNYRYQPRDAMVRQHEQAPAVQRAPESPRQDRQVAPPERSQRLQDRPQDSQREISPAPRQPSAPVAPRVQSPQRPEAVQREQQRQQVNQDNMQRGRGVSQEQGRSQEKARDKEREREERESGDGRGQGRNK
ncbi:hypothetical protein [Propionivibrio limicola]|uniref:hypothetical protein n=1 Tax=Propionivibrio limicola TaxID=167645 RepID=UPI001290C201|nr:hypothetical protein [Propionivibrio limicola]